jgi:membrane fusion protein
MTRSRTRISGPTPGASPECRTKADAAGPIAPEEPVYKAVVDLDRPDVDANGRKVPLQIGMLLQAKIILDRRSLARWVLDPLLNKRL